MVERYVTRIGLVAGDTKSVICIDRQPILQSMARFGAYDSKTLIILGKMIENMSLFGGRPSIQAIFLGGLAVWNPLLFPRHAPCFQLIREQ